jgi:hypothetical protein
MFVTRRCDYVAPVANAPQAPEMPWRYYLLDMDNLAGYFTRRQQ